LELVVVFAYDLIAVRYIMKTMNQLTRNDEYLALAQFRFLIRRFLNNSEKAARSVDLEPQQYMGMLAVRGLPENQEATIRSLAERLQIQHHSAVELVDRMEKRGLFRRERSKRDRRHVILHVTPHGERLLSRLVRHRIKELRVSAPALTRALQSVLQATSRNSKPKSRRSSSRKSAVSAK
jgi:DNA-binding MarR family transcriptional regulator